MQSLEKNGYENASLIRVIEVRAMKDYRLWLRFSTGEEKWFDFTPLLSYPAFKPLADPRQFNNVSLDHGATIWNGGEIDIDPSYLYNNAIK